MKVALVDFRSSFYDRHWAYALIPVLQRHRAQMAWFNLQNPRAVAAYGPDLVLYNAFQSNLQQAAAFDAQLKALHRCKSVVGGPGPTFDKSSQHGTTLDAACIGEGETALDDFIASGMKDGRNLVTQNGAPLNLAHVVNLDQQPFPERDLIYAADPVLRLSPFKAFMSGRGCPYDCTYCFNHAYRDLFRNAGPVVRKKSVDYLMEEIALIKRKYPLKLISFQDDTFIINKRWLLEFAEKYPRVIGVPFVCNIRANLVTEEIVVALKQAGCTVCSWSIESGNERVRNQILHRNMSDEDMHRTTALMRKYKMRFSNASVLGVPTETREEVEDTIRANITAASDFPFANIFVPYPGLRLTEMAYEAGLLERGKPVPLSFSDDSVLSFIKEHKQYLRKTAYLMPFVTAHPWIYRKPAIRALAYKLPSALLRVLYESAYLFTTKRVFNVKTSPRLAFLMLLRYVRGRFS
ncbi:MAG: radical SAM protein [Verrucomicrobia bacterium]|nr:radical SAM protein [Verrucomicrobiota bacterium]